MGASVSKGHWPPRDANIHFCEPAYERNFYIAEFYNAVTNALPVVLGFLMLLYLLRYKS